MFYIDDILLFMILLIFMGNTILYYIHTIIYNTFGIFHEDMILTVLLQLPKTSMKIK